MTKKYTEHIIPSKPSTLETHENCAVWFDIEKSDVWEIRGAEFSISTNKHCVLQDRLDRGGLALRFPRFLREREDKSIEQTTPVDIIYDMYAAQST